MSIPSRHVHIAFVAILFTLIVFLTTSVTEQNDGFDSDGVIYANMVTLPLFAHSDILAPFCQRVFTLQLASFLPIKTLLDKFRVIAFVANVFSLCILYGILIHAKYSIMMSYLGILFYAGVFWTLKFSFYSPAYIDHVSQLMLLAIIYATITRRYALAVGIICLSAFQKESLPLFSIFVAADIWHQKSRHGSAQAALQSMSVIGIAFGFMYLVRSQCPSDDLQVISVLMGQAIRFLQPEFWPIFLHAIFSGLGLLPVIILIQYRPSFEFLRRRPAFAAYLLLAAFALLGGVDKARLFNYSLPVVVLLALTTIQSFKPVSTIRLTAWAVIFLCGHFYLGNYLTPIGPFGEYIDKLVPEHAHTMGAGNSLLFLLRNFIFAFVAFVATVQLMIGEWFFSLRTGLTRRRCV